MTVKTTYIGVVLVLIFLSCQKQEEGATTEITSLPEVPDYFPEVVHPDDNSYSKERWELGKKLFFDPIMSVDNSISCASCHKPELAFSDNLSVSPGVEGRPGTRNAPTLSNVAYHPYFTREGGVPTLEMQILVPIQEHNEFDFNIVDLSERLMKIPEYVEMSQEAYKRDPDHFVITRSIACFERSIISGRSRYDRYLSTGNVFDLNEDERRGMELFFSNRLSCSSCHSNFDFTDYSFANNGLYETYQDVGRFRLTKKEEDKYLFKVPTLRNVAITAPYMHDGSINTLEEVIEHYNSGGKNNDQKSDLIKALDLSENEKQQLKAFLESLTDNIFLNNPKFYENETN